jgi:colicin import membrane protein
VKESLLFVRTGDPFRLIVISVIGIHAMLLFVAYFHSFATTHVLNRPIPNQKVAVQTIRLEAKEAITATTTTDMQSPDTVQLDSTPPSPKSTKAPLPTTEAPPPPTKTTAKPKVAVPTKPSPITKPSPKAKPAAKMAPPSKAPATPPTATKQTTITSNAAKQKLLEKARESLAKVQSNRVSSATKSNTAIAAADSPKALGNLQSDTFAIDGRSFNGSREANYHDALLNRLKSRLQLAEYGDVDIELTLGRSGNVIRVKILRDENKKNRQYIEKNLPTLHFAGFGASFPGETEHTFVIRLSNE